MNDASKLPVPSDPSDAMPATTPLSPPPPNFATDNDLVRSLHGLLRFVYAHNPFYVLSASLFFWGLRVSFDTTQPRAFESLGQTIGLTVGLAVYTLVLAVTTLLVVRFGKVWQDGRTQLLLVVVMLVAISVSFDSVFTKNVLWGVGCSLGGLAFSVLVSEGLLFGLPLRLPAGYRIPYYLFLAMFYLYPIPLGMLQKDPYDPRVPWLLLAFPTVAGVVSLALLPAIRRGPDYVRDNGTPWSWPLYPWCLFFFLALAVCGRSYYLCVSMHQAGGTAAIFAPYFLVPFFFAAAWLLLEMGLVSRSTAAQCFALFAPLAWTVLVATGGSNARVPREFVEQFTNTLGARPLFVTLLFAAAFYVLAAVRRTPGAWGALTASLLVLTFVGPHTTNLLPLAPRGAPLILAGVLQAAIAIRRPGSFRTLLAAGCLLAGVMLEARSAWSVPYAELLLGHLALALVLVLGAAFDDDFAHFLRFVGVVGLGIAAAAATTFRPDWLADVPELWLTAYPAAVIVLVGLYGFVVHYGFSYAVAALAGITWAATAGVQLYQNLRKLVAGLDFLALALISFLAAVAVSLLKVERVQQWLRRRWERRLSPEETGSESCGEPR
jgi:hypothetical protein